MGWEQSVSWKQKYMPLWLVPAMCLWPSNSITTAKEENVKMMLFGQDGVSDVCSLLAERVARDLMLCLLNKRGQPWCLAGYCPCHFLFSSTVLRGSSWPRIVPTLLENRRQGEHTQRTETEFRGRSHQNPPF